MSESPFHCESDYPELICCMDDSAQEDEGHLEEQQALIELQQAFRSIQTPEELRFFLEQEGFEDAIDYMNLYPDNEALQATGCRVLLHILRLETGALRKASNNKASRWKLRVSHSSYQELQASLLKAHAVEVLTRAMHSFPDNCSLQMHAIQLLSKVTAQGRLLEDSHQFHDLCFRALKVHVGNAKLVLWCLHAMLECTKHNLVFRQALIDDGLMPVLLRTLTIYDDLPEIQSLACQFLFLLIDTCKVSDENNFLPCIPIMVRTLAIHSHSTPRTSVSHPHGDSTAASVCITIMSACGVLWHLANFGPSIKSAIVLEYKATKYLTRLLVSRVDDRDALIMICGALCSLSLSSDPQVLSMLSCSFLLDALGPIWYHYHDVEIVAEPVLVILLRLDDFRRSTGAVRRGEALLNYDSAIVVMADEEEDLVAEENG